VRGPLPAAEAADRDQREGGLRLDALDQSRERAVDIDRALACCFRSVL
jgi:hypothetical protein